MVIPSVSDILAHLRGQLPALWRVTTGFCYLMGIVMALKSIAQFRAFTDSRQSAVSPEFKKPMISLILAMVFLYAPRMAKISLFTLFQVDSPTAYIPDAGGSDFSVMIQILGNIVEFIGFVAFIRGWILLSHISHSGSQPGQFAKAMSYIIGGICALNIFGTWEIIKGTLGIT